jgi:hypothetical protein
LAWAQHGLQSVAVPQPFAEAGPRAPKLRTTNAAAIAKMLFIGISSFSSEGTVLFRFFESYLIARFAVRIEFAKGYKSLVEAAREISRTRRFRGGHFQQ